MDEQPQPGPVEPVRSHGGGATSAAWHRTGRWGAPIDTKTNLERVLVRRPGEVRLVLRDPGCSAVGREEGVRDLPEHPGAGDPGGRGGVPRLLDRRAPSSRSSPTAPTPRCSTRPSPPHREHPPGIRRAAHAQAVQPPGPHGRVGGGARPDQRRPGGFGTGRSSTRAELEGFGIDPSQARGQWEEAIRHVVGCWTNDEYEFEGEHWSMPKRRVLPKPLQKPTRPSSVPPPAWTGTSTSARRGSGCARSRWACRHPSWSRASSTTRPASASASSRSGPSSTTRSPRSPWSTARPPRRRRTRWPGNPSSGTRQPEPGTSPVADWMAEQNQELGTYAHYGRHQEARHRGDARPDQL